MAYKQTSKNYGMKPKMERRAPMPSLERNAPPREDTTRRRRKLDEEIERMSK